MHGVGLAEAAALVTAGLALGTFAIGLRSLTARSRLRAKLAVEVDICSKLHAGEGRVALQAVAERDAVRLGALESPEAIRRRQLVAAGVLLSAGVAAGALWVYTSEGWSGLWALAVAVVPPALLALKNWADRRAGVPDLARMGPHLPR